MIFTQMRWMSHNVKVKDNTVEFFKSRINGYHFDSNEVNMS